MQACKANHPLQLCKCHRCDGEDHPHQSPREIQGGAKKIKNPQARFVCDGLNPENQLHKVCLFSVPPKLVLHRWADTVSLRLKAKSPLLPIDPPIKSSLMGLIPSQRAVPISRYPGHPVYIPVSET